MDEFIPLVRPPQSQVSVDPSQRDCPSDGFNYPNLYLVNKQTRVYLSQPFDLDQSITYHPFATANAKGWFAAIRKIGSAQDIIFSPLEELRDSLKNARESEKDLFVPKRDLSVEPGLPIIVAFAHNDTRLVVGFDQGSIFVYDTAMLLSSGSDPVSPLHTYTNQPGALRQIVPNPGVDGDLVSLIAVVRSDGKVQLLSTRLESLGGWSAADPNACPVAVSWSPRGKHLAIGLSTGDVLTYSLTNKSTPNKHIPSAAGGRLTSVNWLSPGHTFRLSYAPSITNEGEPIQQIVSLDTKSNVLTVFNALHPFTMSDRRQQSHALILPHWDEDSVSENSKSLIVVGDEASTDLEILGGINGQWHQQSQENPLSLPLDQQTDETTLLALDVDLTDMNTSTPVLYAYLNDGSLQGWHMGHSKPYLKMISPGVGMMSNVSAANDMVQDSAMSEKDSSDAPSASAFNQPSNTMPRAFGEPQNSAFGAPSVSGQSPQPAFGQTSGFGSLSPATSSFGTYGFGQPSAFGAPKPTDSAFGSASFGSTTGGAFGSFGSSSGSSNVFGQPNFSVGSAATLSPPAPAPDEMTREASMSDATAPSFGGLSLGGRDDSTDNTQKTSIFGSLGATPPTTQPPASSSPFGGGGLIKPATGFGAFSNFNSTLSAAATDPAKPTTSPFSPNADSTPTPVFGQTGTRQPAFGQSSFGQPSFGKPNPATTSGVPGTGGFAAFASSPTSFSSTSQNELAAPRSGGFAAFASGGSSAFGAAPSRQDQTQTIAGSSPFSSNPEPVKSAFPPGGSNQKAFGSETSVFAGGSFSGSSSTSMVSSTPKGGPAKPSGAVMSPPSSPEPTRTSSPFGGSESPPIDNKKPAPASTNAFVTSSVLKPATGFGAFGSTQPSSSPFFKKPEDKSPPVTAFGSTNASSVFKPLSTTTPIFGASSQLGATNKASFSNTSTASPAFGAPSKLGAPGSAFSPLTSTAPTESSAAGAFSAFSGSSSAFSAFAGQKASFSDLLKGSDKSKKDQEEDKPTSETSAPKIKEESKEPLTPPKLTAPVSVFGSLTPTPTKGAFETPTTPKTPTSAPASAKEAKEESTTPKQTPGGEMEDPSLSNASLSSAGSSFVDVGAEKSLDEGDKEEDEDGDDARSLLSEDFESEPPTDEEASDEEDQLEGDERNSAVATPVSSGGLRSTSPTPQPEVPSIQVTPSPTPSEGSEAAKRPLSPVKEESTTPPGSPSKEARSTPSKSPSPTPFSAPSPPTPTSPTPFGIGLGRPSTRPARSSPLAAAPVSGDDEEEEEGENQAKETSKPLASPRPLAGRLSPAIEERIKQGTSEDASFKRPRTPPLLSSFGAPTWAKPTPLVPVAPKPEPASSLPGMLPISFGSPSPALGQKDPSAAASSNAFTKFGDPEPQAGPEPKRPATTPAFPSAFGKSPGPSQIPASSSAPTTPTPSFSLPSFSLAPKATSTSQDERSIPSASSLSSSSANISRGGQSAHSIFGSQTDSSPSGTPKAALGSVSPKPSSGHQVPPPAPSLEEGMQKECALLVTSLNRDLEELRLLSEKASKKRAELSRSAGGSKRREDLGDASKWELSDAATFGQTLLQFASDFVALRDARELDKQALRELNSNMLKANTRREEISRFNKAKTDKDFAKMLTSRALGPEHLETQQQLRRSIRAMRDRVQKLESHLQESKKKLSRAASGKPSIRPPSLDTINRTYRNIDMAIQRQTDDITRLADRMVNLHVAPAAAASRGRDARLPDQRPRSLTVTPDIAITTAAALNAERSAQKLKKALLAARKEPILNQQAALAPPPPVAFKTPQKLSAAPPSIFHVSGPLFSPPAELQTPPPMNWTLPDDNFSPGSPLPSSRRGASSNPKKHGSVPLKKSPAGLTQSPPGSSFEWGPLPTFNNPPLTKLPAEVKPTSGFVPLMPATPTPSSNLPANASLSGGFGKKSS